MLYRQNHKLKKIITEEKAGIRAGRSTTEQVFNFRSLCEKYLQHQQNLIYVFIEKTWHAMRKYYINANPVRSVISLQVHFG